jgi:hypothetical protein
MFLKHPETQEFCDYTMTGRDKWGRSHHGNTPLLNNTTLDRMFLQGNMHIVWDIWSPILDPLEGDILWFTTEGASWGHCFKESTLTALNWMVTHYFHPGPGGNDKASEGMSHDIHKGDLEPGQMQKLGLNPNSWPPIQKPAKWSNPRRNVTTYGALLGSTFSGACEVEIDEQIKDEVNMAGGYGALPPGLPEEFHNTPTAEEAVTFLNNAYQKEIDALEKIKMDAEDKLLGLSKKKDQAVAWYRHKVHMVNQYRQIQDKLDFDTIFNDAKRTFESAYAAQRANATVNQPIPAGIPSCETALRSFGAMCWWFERIQAPVEEPEQQPQASQ